MVITMCLCLFAIERFGRKMCLFVDAFFMGSFMLITGVLLKTDPPIAGAADQSKTSHAMIVCICLYVTAFCFSWDPFSWIYASEI